MKLRFSGELKIIIGAAFFSFIPVGVKMAEGAGVFALLMGRLVVAAAVLSLLPANRKELRLLSGRNFFLLVIWSCIMAGAMVAYFYAIRLCGMGLSSALLGTQPVIISFLALFILREKLNVRGVVAVLLAAGGIICLNGTEVTTGVAPGVFAGKLLAVLSALLLALNFIFQKKFLPGFKGNTLVFFQSLFQLPFLFPFLLMEETTAFDADFLLAVLLLGLICSVASYSLIYSGARELSAQKTGILQSIEYVMPVILGLLFYHEETGFPVIAGAGMILLSCILVSIKGKMFFERNKV